MIDRRRLMTLLGLLACPLLGGPLAVAQPVVIDHEYEYKAAYLYHFAGLCTWRNGGNGPMVVGVLGPDRFGRQLQRIERQSENLQRRIETRVFADVSDLEPCHILFISGGAGDTARRQQALQRINRPGTLIFTEVGDPDFVEDGVAVNFYIEDNRLKLRINLTAADQAGVTIPERLRTLSSVTIRRQEGDE